MGCESKPHPGDGIRERQESAASLVVLLDSRKQLSDTQEAVQVLLAAGMFGIFNGLKEGSEEVHVRTFLSKGSDERVARVEKVGSGFLCALASLNVDN